MKRFMSWLAHGLFFLLLALGAALSYLALSVHFAASVKWMLVGALALALLAALALRFRSKRLSWGLLIAALGTVGLWYSTLTPLENRTWEIDVSRGVKAQIEGDIAHLSDIRDFDWKTEKEAEPRWINKSYDLTKLDSLDLFTSVWDSPDIAHILVSFGFSDGEQLVYSVEIRREAGEVFNQIGGFFRQFELVLIAATEEDIIKLRTNHRKETVRLFPVDLDHDQLKAMFLAYAGMAQELEAAPRFYNTITTNCTTAVYGLAKVLKSDLPLDKRLMLTGRIPSYLQELGVLGDPITPAREAAALITPKGQSHGQRSGFSEAIRRP